MVTIQMTYPLAEKPNVHGIFLINFNKDLDCKPEVETMVIEGNALGKPIKQEFMKKDKMVIVVDDSFKFSEKTVVSKYNNGFGVATLGTSELIENLKTGKSIKVYMMKDTPPFIFPLPANSGPIDKAKASCF